MYISNGLITNHIAAIFQNTCQGEKSNAPFIFSLLGAY